jgi:hypothetical protein
VDIVGLVATTPTLPPSLRERAISARRGVRFQAGLGPRKRPSNLRVKLAGLASRELLRCLAGRCSFRARFFCARGHAARSLRAVR